MDSIQFYQPSVQVALSCAKVPKTSIRSVNASINEEWFVDSANPFDQWVVQGRSEDQEKLIDVTDSPPRTLPSQFEGQGLEGVVLATHVGGKDIMNDLDQSVRQDCQTLFDCVGTSKAGLNHGVGENPARHLNCAIQIGCGASIISETKTSGDMMDPTMLDDKNSDHAERVSDDHIPSSPSDSEDSTAGGHNQASVSSESGSEESHQPFYEHNFNADSNLPSPYLNGLLLLMLGEKISKSRSGDRTEAGLSPISSTKEDPLGREGLESGNEEVDIEESLPAQEGEATLLLRSRNKRPISSARTKSCVKRRNKRHRFSSPLPSDEETEETGNESDVSNYVPSRSHINANITAPSRRLTGIADRMSEETELGSEIEWSKMPLINIVYKQQKWEGEIIAEKEKRQRRGRPRKQYLVRWKSSWVDSSRLAAPGLVERWREEKASRCRG